LFAVLVSVPVKLAEPVIEYELAGAAAGCPRLQPAFSIPLKYSLGFPNLNLKHHFHTTHLQPHFLVDISVILQTHE
jgi:hypothetical protein